MPGKVAMSELAILFPAIAHDCFVFGEDTTLRTNEYGLRASSGSSGHPLPDEFASCESFLMSVSRMESVTSQRNLSKALAPIAFK